MANKWKDKITETLKESWSNENIGSSLGSLTSGVTGIIQSVMNNSKIKDTTEDELMIDSIRNTQFSSGSFDNLLQSFDSNNLARTKYTKNNLRGLSTGEMWRNTLLGTTTGALNGAVRGGWVGAAVEGGANFLGGIGGMITSNARASKKAEELNAEAKLANQSYLNNFNNAVSNTKNTMFNNSLLNLAARGGRLYKGNLLEDGGPFQHGGIFSNDIIIVNNGGTHEQNPLEGVQIGVDPQGIPNLVEEGEVIWNDYVFSNRLKPTEEFKIKYKVKGETFADVAKKMQKESEERPNDPISKRGLNDSMMKLMLEQEKVRSISKRSTPNNMFDRGGKKTDKSESDTLDTSSMLNSMFEHDYYVNQLGYRSVEEGKRIERESKTQKVIKDITGTSAPLTLEDIFSIFRNDKKYKTGRNKNNKFPGGGFVEVVEEPVEEDDTVINQFWGAAKTPEQRLAIMELDPTNAAYKKPLKRTNSYLRYAPVLGSGLSVISDLFGNTNTPDFNEARHIRNAVNSITPIDFTPIGDYLSYNPLDPNYLGAQLGAQAAAGRRGIVEQSANPGMAVAGLLALNKSSQEALGAAYRQGLEYNQAQRERVAGFNRQTNAMNSEMALKAGMANKELDELKFKGALAEAELMAKDRQQASAARSANLTTLFDNLGAIGKEEVLMKMIENNPSLLYDWMGNYKGSNTGACGGFLTIKNKRRKK